MGSCLRAGGLQVLEGSMGVSGSRRLPLKVFEGFEVPAKKRRLGFRV